MQKKTLSLILAILTVGNTSAWAQTQSNEQPTLSGPVSFEPAVEKDGVRVTLRTSIEKKNELSVLVKISNLSDKPILVSPDAVEASTEEGFIIQPVGASNSNPKNRDASRKSNAWSKFSKAAALIPFNDPYRVISTTKALAEYAERKGLFDVKPRAKNRLLHEVILQPGMATHGLIIYDASSLNAFDYAPTLRIKVTVSGEPFEFKFASQPKS